jgi:hypothetical protein
MQIGYTTSASSGSFASPSSASASDSMVDGASCIIGGPGGSYHSGGYHSSGSSSTHSGSGYCGGAAVSSQSMEGRSSASRPRDGDDFFTSVLGTEVGSKVSGGFWSAFAATKTLAGKAKEKAEERVKQAQTEGWVDAITDTAKQGVGAAVETSTWAAQRSLEAGKTTYSYMNEKGGSEMLSQTTEVFEKTAKSSVAVAGSSIDWLTERMLQPAGNEAALQAMSSGRMQGFGSDCSPHAAAQASGAAPASYHGDVSADSMKQPSAPAAPKADIWSDEAWDDWN